MSVTKAIETDSTGHYADAGLVDESTLVADRWRGTDTDRHDMTVLGKKQVLRRNFNFVTMLGFSSTVICTWEFMLAVLNFGLIDGGTALLFWGTIISTIGMTFVYASLAEMASIAPTAGGQYHWVSEFAPPRIQKPLSYAVGRFNGTYSSRGRLTSLRLDVRGGMAGLPGKRGVCDRHHCPRPDRAEL